MIAVISSWLLTYMAHGIVIGIVAIVMRKVPSSAAQRSRLMRFALLAPFVTVSIAVSVGRGRSLTVIPFASTTQKTVEVEEYRIRGAPVVRTERSSNPLELDIALAIVIAGAASLGFGFVLVVRRHLRAQRLLSNRVRCDIPASLLSASVRVSRCDRVAIPVALRGREICVSNEFQNLHPAEKESVLLHEYAHIERRDPEWLDASRAVATLFWWQPLNRLIVENLEIDTELAADHLALSKGASAHSLISALSHFAGVLEISPVNGATLLRDESPLLERARLILSQDRSSKRDGWASMILVGAFSIGLLFAPRLAATAPGHAVLNTRTVEERNVVLR